MNALDRQLAAAFEAHRVGDLERARRLYEGVLAAQPQSREALHYLGLVHFQEGRPLVALAHMERAGSRQSRQPAWLEQLGEVYRALGRHAEAEACFRRALELDPRSLPARGNLGLCLEAQGRLAEARAVYEALLRQRPDLPGTRVNLGVVLAALGDHDGALAQYEAALRLAPDHPEAHLNLAVELVHRGEHRAALVHFDQALRLKPGDAEAWVAAGRCLMFLGEAGAAIRMFEKALALSPDNGDAAAELAAAHSVLGRHAEALRVADEALERTPAHAGLLARKGGALVDLWRSPEGIGVLRRAVRLFPSHKGAWTAYLLDLHYCETDPERLWQAHLAYARSVKGASGFGAARPGRPRLRVGYVSPDFRGHPVAFFLFPLLAAHDRGRFEIYAYSANFKQDPVTEVLKRRTDHWRVIAGREADEVARLIREDGIDILVDLAGHTGDNRLDVFALRPAPVQVTYLGYPDTTGLPQMDYRITDAWADPPGATERWHSETLVRLPSGFLCYEAPEDTPPPAPPPHERLGHVSFGCFNNHNKLTPEMIALWCRILRAVPDARMVLKSSKGWDGEVKGRILACFGENGVSPERVVILERTQGAAEHLEQYREVDIALDTYPYHGTTTTFEALYMGVPVITLAGPMHCARVGVSILNRVGCAEWVAETPDDYVAKAVALARGHETLRQLRQTLRGRMRWSGVMDRERLTREVEAAYLDMWARYEREGVRTPPPLPPEQADEGPLVPLTFGQGERLWLPDDPLLMTVYVLLEQEDWFEDEIRLLRRLVQPGMTVLDLGAGDGVYTVTFARATGRGGRVWSVESDPAAHGRLVQTVGREGLAQVTPLRGRLAAEPTAEAGEPGGAWPDVAALVAEHVRAPLDFVRVRLQEDPAPLLAQIRDRLSTDRPVMLLHAVRSVDRGTPLGRLLHGLGYGLFRAVPGLEILAPWTEGDARAARNVFACPRQRLEELEARGWLARKAVAPRLRAGEGWERVCGQAYAANLATGWRSAAPVPGGDAVRRALDAYVAAADAARSPAERLGALECALAEQQRALAALTTPARLSTAARIASELGLTERARLFAEDAAARIEAGLEDGAAVEPFLCATRAFDPLVADRPLWMRAMLKTACEELRAPSSFLTPNESYRALKDLAATPYLTPAMERRRQLIRLRFGLQKRPEWTPLLEGSRNESYWRGS